MLGSRTIFRNAAGIPIATLIDARGKAIPTVGTDPVYGIRVASLTYALMTSLAMRFLALTENRETVAQVHAHIATNLVELRKMAPSSSAVDMASPFRDVNLVYLGTPRSDMSIHMEMTDERRIRSPPGAMIWFTYDPKGDSRRRNNNRSNAPKNKATVPIHYFIARCDGHSIISQKDSFITKRRAELDLQATLSKLEVTATAQSISESDDESTIPGVSP
jgi:hypothetical protein